MIQECQSLFCSYIIHMHSLVSDLCWQSTRACTDFDSHYLDEVIGLCRHILSVIQIHDSPAPQVFYLSVKRISGNKVVWDEFHPQALSFLLKLVAIYFHLAM